MPPIVTPPVLSESQGVPEGPQSQGENGLVVLDHGEAPTIRASRVRVRLFSRSSDVMLAETSRRSSGRSRAERLRRSAETRGQPWSKETDELGGCPWRQRIEALDASH